MKSMMMVLVGCVALLSVAADLDWPADFDAKVAARGTARTAATSVEAVSVPSELDVRMDVRQTSDAYGSAFDAIFLALVPTQGIPFDPNARIGLMIWVR